MDKSQLNQWYATGSSDFNIPPFGKNQNNDHAATMLESFFRRVFFNQERFLEEYNWENVLSYLDDPCLQNKFLACQLVRLVSKMNQSEFDQWLSSIFSSDDLVSLRIEFEHLFVPPNSAIDNVEEQFSKLLETNALSKSIVLVPSFKYNLKSLYRSVLTSTPVVIEGAVGVGKTCLVDSLALIMGRSQSPRLTRIQLGDQIDSKMLIGSYVCTEVPGEFVWKAGPLTSAMSNGDWLLFEDIDFAPPDVLTVVTTAVKSRSLSSLPGSHYNLPCHADFRAFFTRRTKGDQLTRSFMEISEISDLIVMEPMVKTEVQILISEKWPSLKSISNNILNTYFLICENETTNSVGVLKYIGSDRMASLRDLLKWCARLAKYFDPSRGDAKIAQDAFLDATDCFIPDPIHCLPKSLAVGTYLNINKTESESLIKYSTYEKPDIKNSILKIGRVSLPRKILKRRQQLGRNTTFAFTQPSLKLMEKISAAVENNEPVLLVGETGTGKTSTIQYIADQVNATLLVVNLNQQSDSTDLIGGFKPVDFALVVEPLIADLKKLIPCTFSSVNAFFEKLDTKIKGKKWNEIIDIITVVTDTKISKALENKAPSLSKDQISSLTNQWKDLKNKALELCSKWKIKSKGSNVVAFSFIEGTLINAMKNGHWILLDEINLAQSEVLQSLSLILDTKSGNEVVILDKVDGEPITRHPDFRIFGCMNPATDIGKCNLPLGIRNRFTEYYVDDLESESDLRILVTSYLPMASKTLTNSIVSFYISIRSQTSKSLSDTTGHRPYYSLRTLCRALAVTSKNPCNDPPRSLYESFCLSFLTQLDSPSRLIVETMIAKIFEVDVKSVIGKKICPPSDKSTPSKKYLQFQEFWLPQGDLDPVLSPTYIMTETIERNLKDIARVISIGQSSFPILLQGETSVGKTSLITWLAAASGNKCFRVNNHEHTDLSEYIGSYVTDEVTGSLVFKEGVLIQAMRKGYWIILDELNLASSEVLEALNRALDDNREYFITETQTLVRAHPNFILFATQNPPGVYGGRKVLSRAFRNRFIELHFDEIPPNELSIILEKRCLIPKSHSKKMVDTMLDLQLMRRGSNIFAGKSGFITLRDLFRWGDRYRMSRDEVDQKFFDWDSHIASIGFMILAGRVRKEIEVTEIKQVLEKRFLKNKKTLDVDGFFDSLHNQIIPPNSANSPFEHVVWTKEMKRMAVLTWQALKYKEPVLLVGETGCGKTTICQMYAHYMNQEIRIINCHMNSESSDFLGSLRPVRDRQKTSNLFEWVDGPLVDSMKDGSVFLIDEISLADDSVLERLNSVLEPERNLLLAEKGSNQDQVIEAAESFRFISTMNPGGDYGKKELSPALRNRFTEIWCPSTTDIDGISRIVKRSLDSKSVEVVKVITEFVKWFKTCMPSNSVTYSIRDLLTWVSFINLTTKENILDSSDALIQGAHLVFIDSLECLLGTCDPIGSKKCREKIQNLVSSVLTTNCRKAEMLTSQKKTSSFGFHPFYIPFSSEYSGESFPRSSYSFDAKGVRSNVMKILRAMQLPKAILLEGIPGVGKTSLVETIAKITGHFIVRINLSEQTDISDLFGADLPQEPGDDDTCLEGAFSWRDGPLLRALKTPNTWIILDELNLASQSVLEGLNSVLDHRGEIFVSELNKKFSICANKTRIFATQNPLSGGGSRKGLPKSFLNRFTNVYINKLTSEDMIQILANAFPKLSLQNDLVVKFNQCLSTKMCDQPGFGGQQFEFNLRDIFRVNQLLETDETIPMQERISKAIEIVYIGRFRKTEERSLCKEIFREIFGFDFISGPEDSFVVTSDWFVASHSRIRRVGGPVIFPELKLSPSQVNHISSLITCVNMNWLSIVVGSSSEKVKTIQILSAVVGKPLKFLTVSSEMDTIELLGGFEQRNLNRSFKSIETRIFTSLQDILKKYLMKSEIQEAALITRLWNLYRKACARHDFRNMKNELITLASNIEALLNMTCQIGWENEDLNLKILRRRVNKLLESSATSTATFEWIDSQLVEAVTNGDWLLIENTNLCPASVLDRLNCMLEPNGTLVMTEQGCVADQLRKIIPHPDFRLFFTMDPANGELSRAMRNRGVEIFTSFPHCQISNSVMNVSQLIGDSELYQVSHEYQHIYEKLDINPQCDVEFFNYLKAKLFLEKLSASDLKFRFLKIGSPRIPSNLTEFQGKMRQFPIDSRFSPNRKIFPELKEENVGISNNMILSIIAAIFPIVQKPREKQSQKITKLMKNFSDLFSYFSSCRFVQVTSDETFHFCVQCLYWVYNLCATCYINYEDIIFWVLFLENVVEPILNVSPNEELRNIAHKINDQFDIKAIVTRIDWETAMTSLASKLVFFKDDLSFNCYTRLIGLANQVAIIDNISLSSKIQLQSSIASLLRQLQSNENSDVVNKIGELEKTICSLNSETGQITPSTCSTLNTLFSQILFTIASKLFLMEENEFVPEMFDYILVSPLHSLNILLDSSFCDCLMYHYIDLNRYFNFQQFGQFFVESDPHVFLETSPVLSMALCALKTSSNKTHLKDIKQGQLLSLNIQNFLLKNNLHPEYDFSLHHKNLLSHWKQDQENHLKKLSFYDSVKIQLEKFERSDNLIDFGFFEFLLGSLSAHSFAPLNTIDPTEKILTLQKQFDFELSIIDTELRMRNFIDPSGFSTNSIYAHPHVLHLRSRRECLNEQINTIKKQSCYRPKKSSYEKLRSSVEYFLTHKFGQKFVEQMCMINSNDVSVATKYNHESCSLENFAFDLLNSFPSYSNIIHPFVMSLFMASHGLKVIAAAIANESSKIGIFSSISNFNYFRKFFTKSSEIFNLDLEYVTSCLQDQEMFESLSQILTKTKSGSVNVSKLLRSSLIDISNISPASSKMDRKLVAGKMMAYFINSWIKSEELRKRKEEEEESLYKTRDHSGELTEEEQDQQDFELRFPNFVADFNDLNIKADAPVTPSTRNKVSLNRQFEEKEILELIDIHECLLTGSRKFDQQSCFDLRHDILTEILEAYGYLFDGLDESKLFPIHLLATRRTFVQKSCFDIYHDQCPVELANCQSLLAAIRNRITEDLFNDAPEHATLVQMLKIIDKINSFSVNNCLMKFLTGLELLLDIINEWNTRFAPRHLKMVDEMTQLTTLIISWRKMEIESWSSSFASLKADIINEQKVKYWFHFYHLFNQFINERDYDEEELITFVKQLKLFIEGSKAGEFQTRLQLLESFTRQSSISQKSAKVLFAANNLFQFYSQFSRDIDSSIKSQVDPLEKEMKDFVKIIPWTDSKRKVDTNFWSVKSTIEKSHRAISKFMKRYQTILRQPITPYMKIKTCEEHQNSIDKKVSASVVLQHINLDNNSSKLEKKIVQFSQEISKSLTKDAQITSLDEMNSDLIEGILHYSSLQVTTPKEEKEKRLKEGHAIHNQKRKALSNLFKVLSTSDAIDGTHHHGLTYFETFEPEMVIINTGPLNAVDHVGRDLISSCDKYFYSTLARFVTFKNAIQASPSKEMTMDMIARMKGYSGVLMKEISGLRRSVSDELRTLKEIEELFARYSVIPEGIVTQQDKARGYLIESFKFLSKVQLLAQRIKMLIGAVASATSPPNYSMLSLKINSDAKELDLSELNVLSSSLESKISQLKQIPFLVTYNIVSETSSQIAEIKNILSTYVDEQAHSKNAINCSILDLLETSPTNYNPEKAKIKPTGILEDSIVKIRVMKTIENLKKLSSTSFENIFKNLNSSLLCEKLQIMAENIDESLKNDKINYVLDSIQQFTPFVQQFINLENYFIHSSICCLKEKSKLLHILLGLFTDLTINGFCLPTDLKEELEQMSDDGLFKEIEDGGLGDGEGTTDVSEKIESEDQLESSHVSGQEKEEPDQDNKDIESEENAVEMSDDFKAEAKGSDGIEGEDDENKEKDEVEDQMGKDVEDQSGHDNYDKKLWEDENETNSDLDDDDGADGKGEEFGDSQMVAKDDEKVQNDKQKEGSQPKEDEVVEINDAGMQDEYEGEQQDEIKNDQSGKSNEDTQDLPDDMDLDNDNENDGENKEEENNESGDEGFDDDVEIADNDSAEESKDEELKEEQDRLEITEELNNDENQPVQRNEPILSQGVTDERVQFNQESNEKDPTDVDLSNQEENFSAGQNEGGKDSESKSGDSQSSAVSMDDKNSATRKKGSDEKSKRSLASQEQETFKRQKILPCADEKADDQDNSKTKSQNLYQHIGDDEKSDDEIIDLTDSVEENLLKKGAMMDDEVVEVMDVEEEETPQSSQVKKSELTTGKELPKSKPSSADDVKDEEVSPMEEQSAIKTEGPGRSKQALMFTQLSVLEEQADRDWIKKLVSVKKSSIDGSIDRSEALKIWNDCCNSVSHLVYELCAQLQLVLEPTKCTKLKGDFRTGKRINMRKVIQYIASSFRKDKIWLKRSKPSQRNYQIVLALDDSFSMDDTQCKALAFESTALLSKSLSLIEAGSLSVMSFGDDVKVLHDLDEPFTDDSGAKIMSQLTFNQKKTKIALLLESVAAMLLQRKQSSSFRDDKDISQLLLIISDGRGIFNEGEQKVRQMVRRLSDVGIFMVFIILDQLEIEGATQTIRKSIFDNEIVTFVDGKVVRCNYMDKFPFPFYIVLRDVSSVPVILGESLRQWFELVTNG